MQPGVGGHSARDGGFDCTPKYSGLSPLQHMHHPESMSHRKQKTLQTTRHLDSKRLKNSLESLKTRLNHEDKKIHLSQLQTKRGHQDDKAQTAQDEKGLEASTRS